MCYIPLTPPFFSYNVLEIVNLFTEIQQLSNWTYLGEFRY